MVKKPARAVALLVVALLSPLAARAAKYNVRWVQIHDPSVAAEAAAREFAARVAQETDGDVRVEVVTKTDMEKRLLDKTGVKRNYSHYELIGQLADGEVEMSQIYTASLSKFNRDMLALSQTYVFRDYDHAESVIEGPLGGRILAMVPPSSGVRALAITYSGGLGIFATKGRAARKPMDMKGLKLHTERFPWLGTYMGMMGVEPVSAPPEAFVLMAQNGFADAVETVVARFEEYGNERGADTIILTDHFLLTTAVVVNEKFYQSLPERYQNIIKRIAVDTSRDERLLSIKLNREGRGRLEKKGVRFIDLTPEEKAEWRTALLKAHDAAGLGMGRKLIEEIRAVPSKGGTTALR